MNKAKEAAIRRPPIRLRRREAGLIVVDIQGKLLPAIFEKERLIQNAVRLLNGAAVLGIPVLATEQYPRGLGATVPEIVSACKDFVAMDKVSFSSCEAAGFLDALNSKSITDVILCGMETHVCVLQTTLDLIEKGYAIFVVADAVSSRSKADHQLGLTRMHDAGAVIVSTEMVLFELLGKAGTPEFKKILELVK